MKNNNYLAHYGVKGMHWGIRRFQPYSETGGRKSGKAGKEIGKAARAEKRKSTLSRIRNYTGGRSSDALSTARRQDINKMSNQELQQHITRLNLERQYRSLTQVDINRGKNYMKTANQYDASISSIAKKAGKTYLKIKTGMGFMGV